MKKYLLYVGPNMYDVNVLEEDGAGQRRRQRDTAKTTVRLGSTVSRPPGDGGGGVGDDYPPTFNLHWR